ncbi:MAG: Type I site-specific restriction-modification system, R (restriction) subunit [Candidatus Methanomarinus sp.]|nr:MAG: Type I site-specific restriction-modification system, R (restriction) subunit [ANME-2 cluster archaeon]
MTKNKITESEIEKFAIELLEKQGYQYIYAPDIAPDSEMPQRRSFEDILLLERLRKAVGRINPMIPADVREDAIKQIQRLNSPELIANNKAFHRMLTEGIKVSYHKDGADRGDLVWLIDFNNPQNNEFLVTNQFTIIEEHKNIALEVLKKLLNDEIKARVKKNLVQSRSLMEMLEDSIKKYHNKVVTTAEVIEELITLSKEIKRMDKEPQEMGLSEFEYAFYTAIADNDSARELMQKEKLEVIVKRTLRQYGYPPDMQALATETVLKQAELIADEITKSSLTLGLQISTGR